MELFEKREKKATQAGMPVLQNPRIFAVREDSRVCDQPSAVSAQPLDLRNFRLAERHPRCPTGEFVTNRKLTAESLRRSRAVPHRQECLCHPARPWRLEMKIEGFLQVLQRFFFGPALACYVDIETLGDKPLPLTPDGSGERTFHIRILPQCAPARILDIQSNKLVRYKSSSTSARN